MKSSKHKTQALDCATKYFEKFFVGGLSQTYLAPISMVHIVTPMGAQKCPVNGSVVSTICSITRVQYDKAMSVIWGCMNVLPLLTIQITCFPFVSAK